MNWFFEKRVRKMYFMLHLSIKGVKTWFDFQPVLDFRYRHMPNNPVAAQTLPPPSRTEWDFSIGLDLQLSKFIFRFRIQKDI